MLEILQREEWVTEIEKVRPLMMNEQLAVINHSCNEAKLHPVYLLFRIKDKIAISYIALINGNKIKHPFHFFYSAFWTDKTLTESKYCECMEEFISALLDKYTNIEIKLPVHISDIRPFLWNNFSVVNYYTYLKNLDQLDYHPITAKNIRRAKKLGYECKHEPLNEKSLQLNLKIFSDFKVYTATNIKKIEHLIVGMNTGGYLTSFNCYKSAELVASNFVFLDRDYKIAYTVLLNKTSRANKDDVHSLLHDFFFTKLKEDGYQYVDLLGGDMRGIASFKSRFNAALTPHFLVKYDKKKASAYKFLHDLKHYAKKILVKIS